MKEQLTGVWPPLDISDKDVLEAMRGLQGYIDITPGDFREVYQAAYALAIRRLLDTLTAASLMSRPVVAVEQGMTLIQAAGLLAERQVSGAPVVAAGGEIVGVVSEKDFLKEMGFGATPSFMQIATHCLHNNSCMIGRLRNRSVGDIMTRPPVTGSPDMRIGEISILFTEKNFNRLPIVDARNRPVGIVTRTDLARAFHTLGQEMKA